MSLTNVTSDLVQSVQYPCHLPPSPLYSWASCRKEKIKVFMSLEKLEVVAPELVLPTKHLHPSYVCDLNSIYLMQKFSMSF